MADLQLQKNIRICIQFQHFLTFFKSIPKSIFPSNITSQTVTLSFKVEMFYTSLSLSRYPRSSIVLHLNSLFNNLQIFNILINNDEITNIKRHLQDFILCQKSVIIVKHIRSHTYIGMCV